jgi:hypothetical protein
MFCQHCGAELRTEAGFCAVCGAATPKPRLHVDPPEAGKQRLDRKTASQARPSVSASAGLAPSPQAPTPPTSRGNSLFPQKAQPTYDAIRQASSVRGTMRPLAPAASLEVRSTSPAPDPAPTQPQEPARKLENDPVPAPASNQNGTVAASPASTTPAAPHYVVIAGSQPSSGTDGPAPALLSLPQPGSNGSHPTSTAPTGNHLNSNDLLPAISTDSATHRALQASAGIHLPQDIPNRVALGALAVMFLSFFLPWVIIGGIRATPLSIGWPVALPLAAILGVFLTVLLPGRALYARFFLALPLCLGCFALGSALLLFLFSSAVAANAVGASFLGVDIGFAFFALAALVLISAGYYKLLRELPLLQSGKLLLAPLPGMLRALSERPVPASPHPTAYLQQRPTQASSQAHPSAQLPLDQAG